jgi:hypothetical protein
MELPLTGCPTSEIKSADRREVRQLFPILSVGQQRTIEIFQISETGISQDFINPLLATIMGFKAIGAAKEWQIRFAKNQIERLPCSYREHLEQRVEILECGELDVDFAIFLAGKNVTELNTLLEQIRSLDFVTAEEYGHSAFMLVNLIDHGGEIIFGKRGWLERGCNGLMKRWLDEFNFSMPDIR